MPGLSRARVAAVMAALSLGGVAACLLFLFRYPLPPVESDAAGYLALARNVAAGAGFTQDGVTPAVYRPPLFSALLGGWFALTGTSSPFSAGVFQSFLHGLASGTAFLLLLELCGSLAWAAGAAAWIALNPLLVTRVAFVLQEPTLVLFTTAAVLCSVRLIKAPSTGRAALAGIAWGVCTLGKVVSWFVPFLLLAMRFLPARMRWTWRGREAAALLICFVTAIAPWTIRNWVRFHEFIPVNGQGAGMLEWNVQQAEIPGEPPGAEVVMEIRREHSAERERNAALWAYILRHPRHFLVDGTLRNAVHFAAPPRDWWVARGYVRPGEHGTGFWILAALFHVPLYLFLVVRTAGWARGGGPAAAGFAILFYWAYWGQHAVIWGDPRFGLAVYPVLVAMVLPVTRLRGGGAQSVTADGKPVPA